MRRPAFPQMLNPKPLNPKPLNFKPSINPRTQISNLYTVPEKEEVWRAITDSEIRPHGADDFQCKDKQLLGTDLGGPFKEVVY